MRNINTLCGQDAEFLVLKCVVCVITTNQAVKGEAFFVGEFYLGKVDRSGVELVVLLVSFSFPRALLFVL